MITVIANYTMDWEWSQNRDHARKEPAEGFTVSISQEIATGFRSSEK
jgi:hypothetical protein